MIINATLINIYNVCRRELWLHANTIRMEHTSDMVYEGKTIEDNSYTKRSDRYREISIEHRHILDTLSETVTLTAKIDYYDPKQGVVHEIKKSEAHNFLNFCW